MLYEIARPWASIAQCNHGTDIQWCIPRITNVLLRTPWNPCSFDSYSAIYETV